jgi:hypothetical protein
MQFVARFYPKRRKDTPEDLYEDFTEEAREEMVARVHAIDDGRNPWAWGDLTIVVTEALFDQYMREDLRNGGYRATEKVIGISYLDVDDFMETSSSYPSLPESLEEVIFNRIKKRGGIITFVEDFIGIAGYNELDKLTEYYKTNEMYKIVQHIKDYPNDWRKQYLSTFTDKLENILDFE